MAEIEFLRRGEVVCATCKKPGHISHGASGVFFLHQDGVLSHEPEDLIVRFSKKILLKRLKEMFPSATVEEDVEYEKGIIDFAIIFSDGGKIAIEYLGNDLDDLADRRSYWADSGVKMLSISDWRRLKIKKEARISVVSLGVAEADLIKIGEPLIYIDPEKHNFIQITPPSGSRRVLMDTKTKKLGRVKTVLKRYSLSQLRLTEGRFAFEDFYFEQDVSPPDLPARLEKKLK